MENPAWGAPQIHAERQKLGFTLAERRVARYLRRRVRRGDPGQKGRAFLANHREGIAAFACFTVPTATFRGLDCCFVIEHQRRQILHGNLTSHPTAEWIIPQLREAFPEPCRYRYVLFDGDRTFKAEVLRFLEAAGREPKRTRVPAPWQHGLAEGWSGSCRRELLDQLIALKEHPLGRVLPADGNYYQQDRLHDSLPKDAPNRGAVPQRPGPQATVLSLPRLGGLPHRYPGSPAA